MKPVNEVKVLSVNSQNPTSKESLVDIPFVEKAHSSVDVLSELRTNLKQAQRLQAKLHFMTQEIKECVKRKF